MSIRTALLASLVTLLPAVLPAQTAPTVGLRDNPPGVHALTGARIVVSPGRVIERGTLVIRDGVIEAVGPNVQVPADARVWDLAGRTIYPGFIDPYAAVGMPTQRPPGDSIARGAVYWSPQVRTWVSASGEIIADEDGVRRLRSQGFTTAMTVPRLGLFRGQTAIVSLGEGAAAGRVIRANVAQAVAMRSDRRVGQGYPGSGMGVMAFIRQTLHDADWHAKAHAAYAKSPAGMRRPESNAALAALAPALRREQPIIIEAVDEEEVLRALRFRQEFPLTLWVRGSGQEYQLAEQFRGVDVPLILPVNFPSAPTVTSPEQSLNADLGQLRHWHLAPENPKRLAAQNVTFAFTADGLGNRDSFIANVRKAVSRGLARDVALAAMTTTPARLLGIERTHGTLEQGKAANVVVANGDLLAADSATIEAVWVDGRRFDTDDASSADPRGQWRIAAIGSTPVQGTLMLTGSPSRLSGTFAVPGSETRLSSATVSGASATLQVSFPGTVLGQEGVVRLSAMPTGTTLAGWGELPDGSRFNFTGERVGDAPRDTTGGGGARGARTAGEARTTGGPSASATSTIELANITPAIAYGRTSPPAQPENVLVRNATIWTQGRQGRLQNADMLVTRGKVARIGTNLQAPRGAVIVDAAGKHVTPGLIDAHLHSGASGGINEGTDAIVPEVRLGDMITADNIWMYRQLAGGLTTAHVMHGSANPIGGQNQLVKMRWGLPPDSLKFPNAPRTVKFALGENPKRAGGDRYPDTRMGTEQIIRDHFIAAKEYEQAWKAWEASNKQGIPPRVDLRLQALADIMNGDILVMSHAYRQDEMLMLMRMAEEFGFRIKAFHHGVEAYKLAPELAAHGAAAVVWSDWGAFKIEAYDNTTYNARVLTDGGVLVSLHSDNQQLSTRMNWEAAKMLRTGLSPEQALALVTINTAKVFGIDDRIGSLEPGKDADFVIWSGDPLSTETHAEQTWVDGRRFFDLQEDEQLRARTEKERAQLIQLILSQR